MGSPVVSPYVGDVVVEVDSRYFRPTEVDYLLGDASKAREELGWEPQISFKEMHKWSRGICRRPKETSYAWRVDLGL